MRCSRVMILLFCLGAASSCTNLTMAPLCHEGNASFPHIPEGVYSLNSQDEEDFSVTNFTITEEYDKGRPVARFEDLEVRFCRVQGQDIAEVNMGLFGVEGYGHAGIKVSATGITMSPHLYDRPALDQLGISSEIFDFAEVIGEAKARVQHHPLLMRYLQVETLLGLLVDNRQVGTAELFSAQYDSSQTVTWFRN